MPDPKRPPKPDSELTPESRRNREYYRKNPDKHEQMTRWRKDWYLKNKLRIQIQKKSYQKGVRDECVRILGGKCESCGELYNPHARISNLEFDHKFYIQSKVIPKLPHWHIQRMIRDGLDPKTQYMLLCHTCHMGITTLRRHHEKAKNIVALATKSGIL